MQSNVSFVLSFFNNLLTYSQFITSAAASSSSSSTTLPAPAFSRPVPFPPPPPAVASSSVAISPIPSAPYRETLTPAQLRALYVPLPTCTRRTSVSFVFIKEKQNKLTLLLLN